MVTRFLRAVLFVLSLFLLNLSISSAALAQVAASGLTPGAHETTLNGLKISYRIAGKGPVALVPAPGWGPSTHYLAKGLAPLEARFTMVYLNPRGTGPSTAPPAGPVSWADLVQDIEAVRQHLGQEKVWLIGHSMAGVMVTHYALAHPTQTRGLILIDTLPAADKD